MIGLAYIGYFGDVVFSVNQDFMLTPTDFEREAGSRWNDHNLILHKPTSQFAGPELEKIKFKIILDINHGVDPEEQLKILRNIRDNGIVLPLVINSIPVTNNYWRLDSIRESNNFYNGAVLIHSEPELSLTEYDDSNTVESEFNDLKEILGWLF